MEILIRGYCKYNSKIITNDYDYIEFRAIKNIFIKIYKLLNCLAHAYLIFMVYKSEWKMMIKLTLLCREVDASLPDVLPSR